MNTPGIGATGKTRGGPENTPHSPSLRPQSQQRIVQQDGDRISEEGISTERSTGYNNNVSNRLQSGNTKDKLSKGELRVYVALVAMPLIALAAALFIKYVICPVWPKPPPGWPTGSTS